MFRLDHWEALEANEKYDQATLAVAKELAFEMCSELFDRFGVSAIADDEVLRVAGRGVTFLIPLRGTNVPMKYAGREGTPRKGSKHSGKRGRSAKAEEP
jgi:hypothetical protein